MLTTDDMGLTIWDNLSDDYDHNELAANWQAVDNHDHTTGKGKQIPTGGIANFAITNTKLGADAVTTDKILNGTILAADLADGIITASKLDQTFIQKLVPLGIVTPWYRPTTSVAVPEGWVICDGSTILSANHGYGGGSITIPDLRNQFVLGASLTGVSNPSVTQAPAENYVGGNNNRIYNHSHTVASHSHTVNSHSHAVTSDGAHYHWYGADGGTVDPPTLPSGPSQESNANRGNDNYQTAAPGAAEAFAYKAHTHYGYTALQGDHTHGGATGSAGTGTNAVGLTTDGTAVGGDIRPNFVGLLYIVKVKHPT